MSRHRVEQFIVIVAAFLFSFWVNNICFAETTTNTDPTYDGVGSSSVFWMLFKVFIFLIILIGLFLIVIRFLAQRNRSLMSGRSVKSLGGLSLGQNKSVQIVEIGHSLYILGVGNDVQLIEKIDDVDELEYIKEFFHINYTQSTVNFPSALEWIKRFRRKEESEDVDLSSSFQAVFQEKMHRVTTDRQRKVNDALFDQNYVERLNDKDD